MTNALADRTDALKTRLIDARYWIDKANKKPEVLQIPQVELEKLYIKTKSGRIIRFALNNQQKRLLAIINEKLRHRVPVRIILLKCRQWGGSTFFTAIVYYLCKSRGMSAVIIGHHDKATQNLYKMVLTYYENDNDFKGEKAHRRKNDNVLRLIGGGEIKLHTAGTKDAATSETNQIILATEQALWQDHPAEQMRSLVNTVSDEENETFVFIESTARGVGNDYHNRWMTAVRKEKNRDESGEHEIESCIYDPVFFGWADHADYVKPFRSDTARERFIETIGKFWPTPEENDEEDRACGEHRLSPEQIYWRRSTIINKCNSNLADFKQEYPLFWEEAFLNTGRALFNPSKIERMYVNANDPIFIGELSLIDGYSNKAKYDEIEKWYIEKNTGRLKIWEWPQQRTNYAIGCDVAEGISVIKNGRELNDDSAIVIRNRETGLIAATWVGKISPEDFADVVYVLGLHFNKAVVCVESNNHGRSTLARLWQHYPKHLIYKQNASANVGRYEYGEQLGYKTHQGTKGALMDIIAAAFRAGVLDIHDRELLKEMSEVQADNNGRYETKGKDLFMALAMQEIANLFMNKQIYREEKQKNRYEQFLDWNKKYYDTARMQQMSVRARLQYPFS